MLHRRLFAYILFLVTTTVVPARADLIVAPNANTGVEGNTATSIPFNPDPRTFQWVFDDSQFAGIAPGSNIMGIGFRLEGGAPTSPTGSLSFDRWDLQISQSLNAPGALSTTFSNNIAADVVLVRSGPLTLSAGSLTGGAGPNPFMTISFTVPYTYTAGDLLLTLRHSGWASVPGPLLLGNLDAVDLPLAVTDSAGANNADALATDAGSVHFFNVPVTQFVFESARAEAPVPGTLALFGLGLAVVAAILRKRV